MRRKENQFDRMYKKDEIKYIKSRRRKKNEKNNSNDFNFQLETHYPESIYIFADENKPERPISYQTLQDKVLRMIYEKDIRDDSGKLFGFGTHMFRHCNGVKLTELHVDDWTIAKLLGHKGVRSVQYYRKMSNQRMADETREVRNFMSQIILASLDGWGEEYEQIRQDAGIE